jgi:hypothetical protein
MVMITGQLIALQRLRKGNKLGTVNRVASIGNGVVARTVTAKPNPALVSDEPVQKLSEFARKISSVQEFPSRAMSRANSSAARNNDYDHRNLQPNMTLHTIEEEPSMTSSASIKRANSSAGGVVPPKPQFSVGGSVRPPLPAFSSGTSRSPQTVPGSAHSQQLAVLLQLQQESMRREIAKSEALFASVGEGVPVPEEAVYAQIEILNKSMMLTQELMRAVNSNK